MNGIPGESNLPPETDLPHHPVLYQQIIQAIQPQGGRKYIDGTLGAGGHAAGILALSSPDGESESMSGSPRLLLADAVRLARVE